jgi:hypothetical protein
LTSTSALQTQRKIDNKENEIRLKTLLLAKLPKKATPTRVRLEKSIERLKQEASALRASLHYYKPVQRLALDIEAQKHHVRTLIEKTKAAKRQDRPKVIKALKAHNQHLKEMLVAAKLKSIDPNMAQGSLPESAPASTLVLPSVANIPENAIASSFVASAESVSLPEDVAAPVSIQTQIDAALLAEAAPPAVSVSPAQALAVELKDYSYLRPNFDLSLGDAESNILFEEAEYAGLLGDDPVDYKTLLIGAAVGLGIGWYIFKGPSGS